jgi:hypothetical protein
MVLVDPEEDEGGKLMIPMEQQGVEESQESEYDGDVDLNTVPQSRTVKLMKVYFKTTPYKKFGGALRFGDDRINHFTRLMKRPKFGHFNRLM